MDTFIKSLCICNGSYCRYYGKQLGQRFCSGSGVCPTIGAARSKQHMQAHHQK